MPIAITPSKTSRVRAAQAEHPDATPEDIAKRTGLPPHEVRALLPDRKRRIKSVAG
jgi:putative heme iron utilization protein